MVLAVMPPFRRPFMVSFPTAGIAVFPFAPPAVFAGNGGVAIYTGEIDNHKAAAENKSVSVDTDCKFWTAILK